MGLKPNERRQAHKAHNIHIKEKEKPKLPLVEKDEREQRITTSDRGSNCTKKKKNQTRKGDKCSKVGVIAEGNQGPRLTRC